MKLSSKPISSPGRTDKFPPPLMMRFLRSNVGSRSRGRSRSSPMFVRKKNAAAIETQEPSSPKVTCMGQVRVRRSKQTGKKPACRNRTPDRHRCRWVRNALFCTHFRGKLKNKSFRPCFRKWVVFFQVGCRRKAEVGENSSKFEAEFEEKRDEIDRGFAKSYDGDEEEEEEIKNFEYSSSTPPKNAFLLTRCRSAPYRSSSLASRFWGSPVPKEETEEEGQTKEFENGEKQLEKILNEKPTSERESICRDSTAESRTDPESEVNVGLCEEFEGSVNERSEKSEKFERLETGEVYSVRPLILTRCKSEPARTAEKLNPESIFWRKEKLWFR